MSYVELIDLLELIPKKQLITLLEKEAPDFLAEIMRLEIPPSYDRLNVPVLATEDKVIAQELNQTDLERFLREKCAHSYGHRIKFSELYDKYIEWLEPNEIHKWSKIRVGRELPPQYPKGRCRKTGQFFVGNIAWAGVQMTEEPASSKLMIKDGYLVPADE